MNYYEHHLGDYCVATAHLTFMEDAAYSRLIRKYYASEKPLPENLQAVQRLVGARNYDERKAVEVVLSEFFVLVAGFWHNRRCDEEIARFQDKQDKAKRSADARWNAVRSERNANAMRTQSEGNAHQSPSTSHQSPDLNSKTLEVPTDVLNPSREDETKKCEGILEFHESDTGQTSPGEVCRHLKVHGIAMCNPSNPTLIALIKAGATNLEFSHAALTASQSGHQNFNYVLAMVKNARETAAKLVLHQGRLPNKQELLEASNRAATAGWMPPEMREGMRAKL